MGPRRRAETFSPGPPLKFLTKRMTRRIVSAHLGVITFDEEDLLHFPAGLPAFAAETHFIIVRDRRSDLISYLQSASTPDLRFILLPAAAVDPGYDLALAGADAEALFPGEPVNPAELATYFIVSAASAAAPTVNKLAPIVIRVPSARGLQAVRSDTAYSHAAPLTHSRSGPGEEVPC
jgi:flagellar assembly factor FliW